MSIEKELGRLQSDVANLKANYKEVDIKLDHLIKAADEQKGARKVLHAIYVIVVCVSAFKFGDIKTIIGW